MTFELGLPVGLEGGHTLGHVVGREQQARGEARVGAAVEDPLGRPETDRRSPSDVIDDPSEPSGEDACEQDLRGCPRTQVRIVLEMAAEIFPKAQRVDLAGARFLRRQT